MADAQAVKTPVRYELRLSEGDATIQMFEITTPICTIGSDSDNDIVLKGLGVSSHHAKLYSDESIHMVQDLGSPQGTFVNGRRAWFPHRLDSGDCIDIGGSVSLTFRMVATSPPSEATDTDRKSTATDETIAVQLHQIPVKAEPQILVVEEAGGDSHSYRLTAAQYQIGRDTDNDICLTSPIVSRHHARLEKTPAGYKLIPSPDTLNPIHLRGQPLSDPSMLYDGDVFRIGSRDPGTMVTFRFSDPASSSETSIEVVFGERAELSVGRDASNDVRLDAPQVSRYHARLEKIGTRFRVRDLRSVNGTFVNGQRVGREAWLSAEDELRVGPYRFVMGDERLRRYDETAEGQRVEVIALNKWVRKGLNILKNLSLVIHPREFVVVVGQSGGGKSTLVDAISGYRLPTHGKVLVNGIDLYRNFDSFRSNIGYVPQRDIIHTELTVRQAFDYAAQLRMLPDTSVEERRTRVDEVMKELDLAHRANFQISELSGGQQKRVSIGVELLIKPGLLFLDEPTSGLDPSTETTLMHMMRRIADNGRTVILITHATNNVMLADKVIFLARGGYLVWFGPPDEALAYFDQYRSERELRAGRMEFNDIYEMLEDPLKGSPEDWKRRFCEHPAYRQYISDYLDSGTRAKALSGPRKSTPPRSRRRQISALRQFLVLSKRNLRVLSRDRFSLLLMFLTAPIIGSLDLVVATITERRIFDHQSGNAGLAVTTLFMLAMYSVMVGALSQMREIVREEDIYRRERLVGIEILPYVASKFGAAATLATYQAACYVLIHYLAFEMPGGVREFVFIYVTLVLATLSGMMLGLFASAVAPNANSVSLIVVILLLPQIVLGGAFIPLRDSRHLISAITTTRWTFDALVGITGLGSDVARDVCWQLNKPERQALTDPEKLAMHCSCMGAAVFAESSCDFPGIGQYYHAAIDTSEPRRPDEPIGEPPQLMLPDPPTQPSDNNDPQAVERYFQEMKSYQASLNEGEEMFLTDLATFNNDTTAHQTAMQSYTEQFSEWQAERSEAIGEAEGVVAGYYDDFGWLFGNSANEKAFLLRIVGRWSAQAVYSALVCIAIVFAQERKDLI